MISTQPLPQDDNHGTEPSIIANAHAYENEGFGALQQELTGTDNNATNIIIIIICLMHAAASPQISIFETYYLKSGHQFPQWIKQWNSRGWDLDTTRGDLIFPEVLLTDDDIYVCVETNPSVPNISQFDVYGKS